MKPGLVCAPRLKKGRFEEPWNGTRSETKDVIFPWWEGDVATEKDLEATDTLGIKDGEEGHRSANEGGEGERGHWNRFGRQNALCPFTWLLSFRTEDKNMAVGWVFCPSGGWFVIYHLG